MAIVPIRSNRAYTAIGKQSTQGVAVAPTLFPRWLEGSSLEFDSKFEDVWEGDTSRRLSTVLRNGQKIKFKLVVNTRPNEIGFFETAALGAGADVYTAPTANTTLSAAAAAAATTFSVVANTGLTGTGTAPLVLSAGTTREEIPTINLPVSGTGPYTATVASTYNGGKLALAHNSADTVQGPPSHVITDQVDGNYYSVEVSLGDAAGIILRVRDCKVETAKRSAKMGTYVIYELEFVGIATVVQGAASTVTLDPHQPFIFTQGVWTLDGTTTGDALAVQDFDISNKNNLDWVQAERIIGEAIIFGNLNMDVSIGIIYQQGNTYIQRTYLGGTTGTTDAQPVGTGSLLLTFTQPDGFHILTYSVPATVYTKAGVPVPKKNGTAFLMPLQASATSNQGSNAYLLQSTVQNTTFAAY